MAAKVTATNPNMFEKDMPLPSRELKEAMMAPTIITEEIASFSSLNGSGISFSNILGFVAVTLAAINIFGGFLVTQRMLKMYKKKEKKEK